MDGLAALGGVTRVDRPARDRVELLLERGAAVGDVLQAVTREVEVVSVHSAAESLREIFIRTVGRADVDGGDGAGAVQAIGTSGDAGDASGGKRDNS